MSKTVFPEVNIDLPGDFQQVRLDVGEQGDYRGEFLENNIEIVNLVADYDLGWGNLLSSSSWIDYETEAAADSSFVFFAPLYSPSSGQTEVFVEELRFTSQFNGPIQVLAGLYYENNESKSQFAFAWSGNPEDNIGFDTVYHFDREMTQKAFFGELSYQLTDQWMATLGARRFDYDQREVLSSSGAFAEPITRPKNDEQGDSFKVNVTYTPTEDTLVYGQWAEGFRLGRPLFTSGCVEPGTNRATFLGLEVQDSVKSDSLENFELGLKTSFADNRVTFNAAVYRINWDDIPVALFEASCNTYITFNAGESKSEGIELELQAQITPSLNLNVSASYGEATLTEDASGLGSKGDNLPGSADVNASIGLEYAFTLAGLDAFVRSDYSYVGEYYNNLAETGQASGGYSMINLKTGVAFASLDVDLYVNNLTNADDFTWVESTFPDIAGVNRAYRLRPRTVGLNIGYRF